jgi:toxin-antitoxin system PIN domain toxin
MSYLLDVNALLALLLSEHSHHSRTLGWVQELTRKNRAHLLTSPITEMGFIRIITQTSVYHRTLPEAKHLLEKAKSGRIVRFSFVPDDLPVSGLPDGVTTPNQITDGYLFQLARNHRANFATLDEKIPGAFLIPH